MGFILGHPIGKMAGSASRKSSQVVLCFTWRMEALIQFGYSNLQQSQFNISKYGIIGLRVSMLAVGDPLINGL